MKDDTTGGRRYSQTFINTTIIPDQFQDYCRYKYKTCSLKNIGFLIFEQEFKCKCKLTVFFLPFGDILGSDFAYPFDTFIFQG
jgi:hypothetical protein